MRLLSESNIEKVWQYTDGTVWKEDLQTGFHKQLEVAPVMEPVEETTWAKIAQRPVLLFGFLAACGPPIAEAANNQWVTAAVAVATAGSAFLTQRFTRSTYSLEHG